MSAQQSEIERLKQCNAQLVAKLEEQQVALQRHSEELRTAHEHLQRVVAHSPAVIYTLKIDGRTVVPTFVSDNIRRISGLSVEDSTRYEWWEQSLHPDDHDRVMITLFKGLIEGGYFAEYRIRHKDGTYRWIEDRNRMLLDGTGQSGEAFGKTPIVTVHADDPFRSRLAQTLI